MVHASFAAGARKLRFLRRGAATVGLFGAGVALGGAGRGDGAGIPVRVGGLTLAEIVHGAAVFVGQGGGILQVIELVRSRAQAKLVLFADGDDAVEDAGVMMLLRNGGDVPGVLAVVLHVAEKTQGLAAILGVGQGLEFLGA